MEITLCLSSGTGPTAVIIALDALYKQGMTSGMIGISIFVGEMRKDRMEMIQNVVNLYSFLQL